MAFLDDINAYNPPYGGGMQPQIMQQAPTQQPQLMQSAPQDMVQGILSSRPPAQTNPMDLLSQIAKIAAPNWQDMGNAASARLATNNPAITDQQMTSERLAPQMAMLKGLGEMNLQNAQANFYNSGGMMGMKSVPMFDPSTGAVRAVSAFEANGNPNLLSVDDPRVKNLIEQAQTRGKMGMGMPDNTPVGGNQVDSNGQPQQSTFGFDNSDLSNNPNALKLAQKNAADFEKNQQQRDVLTGQIKSQIAALRPDLEKSYGGGMEGSALKMGTFFGTDQGRSADNASTLTQGLALNLSNLQQVGGSGRAMKAALMTLLNSKPDPYGHYNENNVSNLNHIEATVNQYDLETKLLDAYKEANPLHIIDTKAENLFSSLLQKFPLETVDPKTGKVAYNPQNAQAFEAAIPDALANPKNYMQGGASQQPQSTAQPQWTMEHVNQVAQQYGKTPQQVMQDAQAKGITIGQ